ncbi:hypothetical protein [Algoriphagus terrigena]|nr:hypothetical protein [Algoriphagus terrigena]
MVSINNGVKQAYFFVTRLNDSTSFEVIREVRQEVHEYLAGGVILDL